MLVVKRKNWLESRIEEEREDAKTYYDKFVETGDSDYRTLSEQELGHAEILERKLGMHSGEEGAEHKE